MNTTIGVFYVLYALSCGGGCKNELPQAYMTRAECEVAGAKWTQGSYPARWNVLTGMTYGSHRAFSCHREELTQRGLDAYGGVKE